MLLNHLLPAKKRHSMAGVVAMESSTPLLLSARRTATGLNGSTSSLYVPARPCSLDEQDEERQQPDDKRGSLEKARQDFYKQHRRLIKSLNAFMRRRPPIELLKRQGIIKGYTHTHTHVEPTRAQIFFSLSFFFCFPLHFAHPLHEEQKQLICNDEENLFAHSIFQS